jgi:addiction module HigA family antidote
MPIKSFKCPDTEALFRLQRVPRFANFERAALRKLTQLDVRSALTICAAHPATAWNGSVTIAPANGAFASTIGTACALSGGMEMPKKSKSLITTEKAPDPVSPGEMLVEEFLKPLGMTNYRLAKEIDVPPQRIGEIIAGRRAITADTDLRLCRFFGLSEGWWLRLQNHHDLRKAKAEIAGKLAKIKPLKEQ